MLDFLKNIHRNRLIKELGSLPREKKIENIDQIKCIGIICIIQDEQQWNILHHFAKVMETQGKEVHIVALLQKDVELEFVITHQKTYLVREKTDLNFWGLPSHECIARFLDESFDVLINTIDDESFFSYYMVLKTNANLKVGYTNKHEGNLEPYDLVIKGEGRLDLKSYFNNIIEYLSMIKK